MMLLSVTAALATIAVLTGLAAATATTDAARRKPAVVPARARRQRRHLGALLAVVSLASAGGALLSAYPIT